MHDQASRLSEQQLSDDGLSGTEVGATSRCLFVCHCFLQITIGRAVRLPLIEEGSDSGVRPDRRRDIGVRRQRLELPHCR